MKKIIWSFLSIFMILIGFTSCSKDDDVAVSGISLDKTSLSITKGETAKLTAVVSPDNATDKTVNWQSSNTSVAMVNQDGIVKAIGKGSTVITAVSADGKCFANCIVTVLVHAESITLSETDVTMKKGESKTLTATINPEDAIDKKLTWTTSNSNVVTVEDGTIKAVNGGTALVTATTEDGNVKASCYVRVTVPVESISISKEQLSLVVGQKYTLSATILPKDATDKEIKWTSSNNNVVSVDNGQVTAKSPGTAIVSAISNDGNHSASCTITVRKPQNVDYNPYGNGQKW